MADSVNDRVREQVSSFAGGTGAVTLPVVAVSGFQTFLSGWGASGTGDYCLQLGAQWETGFGTLNAGGTTLTRTIVYNGSSGVGIAVNFSAGTLDCFGTIPAELAHDLNLREFSVASAATCDIGAVNGSVVAITGTTTITSLGSKKNRRRFIRFTGALTLTHNVTSLILPGGVNITTVAGDTCMAISDGSGNWRVYFYVRKSANSSLLVKGTNTNDAATAGDVGEEIASTVAVGAPVALTSTVTATLTSVALTPGDWEISGVARFTGAAGTTVTIVIASLSTSAATLNDIDKGLTATYGYANTLFATASQGPHCLITPQRVSLSVNTTYFLNVYGGFGVSTMSAYGHLHARRLR